MMLHVNVNMIDVLKQKRQLKKELEKQLKEEERARNNTLYNAIFNMAIELQKKDKKSFNALVCQLVDMK